MQHDPKSPNLPAVPDANAPPESARVRRARVDGFTGPKQAVFLEAIAAGATTREAAALAEISITAIYNFRNRAAGRGFNLLWEAADRRARRPIADRLKDRALEGQAETVRDENQAVIGSRHRYDNRAAHATLTRLDRKAEAYREDERLVTALSEEFEEALDIVEAEGDIADFIDSRKPDERNDYRPGHRLPEPDYERYWCYKKRHAYDAIDPAAIDIADLDPAEHRSWTDDQWARADRSGLSRRYGLEE